MKRFILLLMIVAMVAMGTVLTAAGEEAGDEAPSLSDVSVDWSALEKDPSAWLFDSFVFPEGMLESMSTKALVRSVAEYPYLVLLAAASSNTEQDYVEPFAEQSKLVQELRSRADREEWVNSAREEVLQAAEKDGGGIRASVLLRLFDCILA